MHGVAIMFEQILLIERLQNGGLLVQSFLSHNKPPFFEIFRNGLTPLGETVS
jgi:hypothetical protein